MVHLATPRSAKPYAYIALLALLTAWALSGCRGSTPTAEPPVATPSGTATRSDTAQPSGVDPSPSVTTPSPVITPSATTTLGPRVSVRPLRARIGADLLVRAKGPLPDALRRHIRHAPGVDRTLALALGRTELNGTTVSVAAVDPSTFRAWAPAGTAESDPLWQSVARGELAVAHQVAQAQRLRLGGQADLGGATFRVGAFATALPGVDVVVDATLAGALGLRPYTAEVVSTGDTDPGAVGRRLAHLVGGRGRVDLLTAPEALPRSFLTGSAAAAAFGTFSYRYFADGTIAPDPAWVAANIRTETVPILGPVTCHRLMFPQLRGALTEVVDKGLGGTIHKDEYGGCYVPRFIERDPSRSISLHTWGIAIDLNVPGNQRGTSGEMDRRVVAIFKKWGFAWGGDWSYTDPMHFELAALLQD